MANTDKNIVITPNIGSSSDDPKIVFSGADASTAAQNITLYAYPTDNGTLSFEGSSGQLFSITNSLSGTIFSVNDVSGIPSIEVDDDGTIRFAEFAGNVLIGSATDNGTAKLQVTGNLTSTGEVTAYYSDARLKNFSGTIDNALEKILNLNGYYFTENELAKSLGYNNSNRQVGVSAQEVEAVLPEVVVPSPRDSKYLTVKYDKLIPLLIEAIKEQQKQIDELKDIIKTLTTK